MVRGADGIWKIRGPGKQVSLKANKIGSECFRLWKACEAQVGDDFHINPEEIESKYFGILTKIFNVARFASQFDVPDDLDNLPDNLSNEDRWILCVFDKMMGDVNNFGGDGYIQCNSNNQGLCYRSFSWTLVRDVQIKTIRWRSWCHLDHPQDSQRPTHIILPSLPLFSQTIYPLHYMAIVPWTRHPFLCKSYLVRLTQIPIYN